MKRTKANLLFQLDLLLPDNDQQEISAEDVRSALTDMIDSLCSNSGEVNVSGRLRYSEAFLLDNNLDLVYKSFLVDYLTDNGYLTQGSNLLTENLEIDGDSTYTVIMNAQMVFDGGLDNTILNAVLEGCYAFSTAGVRLADLQNGYLHSGAAVIVDWPNGQANKADGTTPSFNWFDLELNGDWSTDGDFTLSENKYLYFKGDSSTDGSYRAGVTSGVFAIEKRVSGSWATIISE
jgi:hypothetical protein